MTNIGVVMHKWEENEHGRVWNRWTCFQYKCLLHLNVILITKITSELNLHKIRNVRKSEETSGVNSVFGPYHGDLHS